MKTKQAKQIKVGDKVVIRGERLKVTRTQVDPTCASCVIFHFQNQPIKVITYDVSNDVQLA